MSSESLQTLEAQLSALEARIAVRRAAIRNDVVEQIVKLMREYEITAREVEILLSVGQRRRIPPRYWDPDTGATWSGRGKRPRWMQGRDPEDFRLEPDSDSAGGDAEKKEV
ncbi:MULTISPECIES: H-NS family nucleoid-associated regulatory protein [Burkholderia]|uniref:DNA-binding protein H-NS n=1 Tax=Burkholderia pyrrocinia TaxID=60550 RepID=A0A318HZN9_BURPY|nr:MULTISPECIES: H-NS histone family protein [Burkholderia]PXX23832.1 DNA-binding protein H-NS [Burkholderia pyrrocinia]SFW87826.1 DNA-binding protein H-NS [Burkholderia sp. NFACC33-1]SFY46063.1 DNA-binding protein H-NS [Burkholderia sp. NFPP32]